MDEENTRQERQSSRSRRVVDVVAVSDSYVHYLDENRLPLIQTSPDEAIISIESKSHYHPRFVSSVVEAEVRVLEFGSARGPWQILVPTTIPVGASRSV